MLLMGSTGTGKSPLLMAIRKVMALIEYANPDVIVCPAYVHSPGRMIPQAYIADVMHRRGILTGIDGVLPAWCNPSNPMDAKARQEALQTWIDDYRQKHGKQVVPAVLIDDMNAMNAWSEEARERFILHLRAMAEHKGSTIARFTGIWTDVTGLLSGKSAGPLSHYRKLPK